MRRWLFISHEKVRAVRAAMKVHLISLSSLWKNPPPPPPPWELSGVGGDEGGEEGMGDTEGGCVVWEVVGGDDGIGDIDGAGEVLLLVALDGVGIGDSDGGADGAGDEVMLVALLLF